MSEICSYSSWLEGGNKKGPWRMETGFPCWSRGGPDFTRKKLHSFKMRIQRYMKELPWIIVSIETVLFVSFLLGFFAYVLSRPDCKCSETRVIEGIDLKKLPIATFRKMQKWTQPITTERPWGDLGMPFISDTNEIEEPLPLPEENPFKELITEPSSFSSLPPLPSEHIVSLSPIQTIEETEEPAKITPGFTKAAIYSDYPECSEIGRSVLLRGGNAMDSAIATAVCLTAALPHKASFGGGLTMSIVSENGKDCITVNARETAPAASRAEYFAQRREEALVGGKASAVPGFLNGLYRAYEQFSTKIVPFNQLLLPTVIACERGLSVSAELAEELKRHRSMIVNDVSMRNIFANENNYTLLAEGDTLHCHQLAEFLTEIAEHRDPLEHFYRGVGAEALIRELKEINSLITAVDLEDYEAETKPGLRAQLTENISLCGPQPPSTFPLVQLAVAAAIGLNDTDMYSIQRQVWELKQAIADPLFMPESTHIALSMLQHEAIGKLHEQLQRIQSNDKATIEEGETGATSLYVVDENGMAVSLTTTLGHKFGNRYLTRHGFFMNNAMSSFTLASEHMGEKADADPNALQPGKAPRTRASPLIGMSGDKVHFLAADTDFISLTSSIYSLVTHTFSPDNITPILIISHNSSINLQNGESEYLTGY